MSSESTDTIAQGLKEFFTSKSIVKDYATADRATGPPARSMLHQAGLSSESLRADVKYDSEYEVLDNACGPGVVTALLYEELKEVRSAGGESGGVKVKVKVVCGDLSAPMVESMKERLGSFEGLEAQARELNGQALDLPSNHFTHVLTNFGFQSFADPLAGIRESVRVAKPGGTIAMTNWIRPGWASALHVAISRIPGAPRSLPASWPFPPDAARTKLGDAAWTREQLEGIPEVDPASIRVEEHSFVMALRTEEEARALVRPLEKMLDAFTGGWSGEEREACGGGKLVDGVVKAIVEEPELVWRSLVTTVLKRV